MPAIEANRPQAAPSPQVPPWQKTRQLTFDHAASQQYVELDPLPAVSGSDNSGLLES